MRIRELSRDALIRGIAWRCAAIVACACVCVVLAVSWLQGSTGRVLFVAGLLGDQWAANALLGIGVIPLLLTLTLLLASESGSASLGGLLLLLASIGVAALSGFLWLIASSLATVTPLEVDSKPSNLVAVERSFLLLSSSTIHRVSGLMLTELARGGGDDGHRPFLAGDYLAVREGAAVHIWYCRGDGADCSDYTPSGPADLAVLSAD
jgi:hypothetical protein